MWGTNPRWFKTRSHSRIRCYYRLSLQKWTFSLLKQAAGVATSNCFTPVFSSKSLISKYNNRWGSFHSALGRWSNIYSHSNCMVAVATLALRKALEWIELIRPPPLEENLIKCMDNIVKLDRQTSWIKEARSVNFDFRISARVLNSWQWAWKVAQHSFLSLQIQVLLFPISLSLFFALAHTTEEQGCWSQSPTWSSNMQPGSQMIKAVAGGLHFETINRPVGAESNSKPSISVSPSRSVAQREGELRGREGSLHLCILSLHGTTLLRGRWSGVGE